MNSRGIAILYLLILSTSVMGHDAVMGRDAQTAAKAKVLEDRITNEGNQIKAFNTQIDDLQKQRSVLENKLQKAQSSPADYRADLVKLATEQLATNQRAIDDVKSKLTAAHQEQVSDLRQYHEIQPRLGLYHVYEANDFLVKKPEWVQPWYVKPGQEVTRFSLDHMWYDKRSQVMSPLAEEAITGFQEEARLYRDASNGDNFEVHSSTSYIQKIVVSETDTWGGDDFITVTFSDKGEIRYKQPAAYRYRADHDLWVRTYDWHVSVINVSPHKPAPGQTAADYPADILIMRPKVEGDGKADMDLTQTTTFEATARASGIIGAVVVGIVGIAGLFAWVGVEAITILAYGVMCIVGCA